LHRIQQISDCAISSGRVVATLGMSLKRNVRVARELGVLELDESHLASIQDASHIESSRLCVIATGSQGEPMSTLARAAVDENKYLELTAQDLLLLSSRAIPGNEFAVNRMINQLVTRRVEVIHSGVSHVHASGHAQHDELQEMLLRARPEWFVPVHGEPRHLAAHARIAVAMGISNDRVLLCENGDRLRLTVRGCKHEPAAVSAEHIFVDGLLHDVTHGLLKDRHILGQEGLLTVFVVVDLAAGSIVVPPAVVSHGWIDEQVVPHVLEEMEEVATEAIEQALVEGFADVHEIRQRLRRAVGKRVFAATKRRPVISPIVIEI
jgi:ribonuclease J